MKPALPTSQICHEQQICRPNPSWIHSPANKTNRKLFLRLLDTGRLLRPIYTVQLCRMRCAHDRSTTRVVSCKSNLQLACDCRVRHEECRGLLKHVLKPYDNRSDWQFDIVEVVYDFSMTRAARALKIACDNRKQKSYRVNRPLQQQQRNKHIKVIKDHKSLNFIQPLSTLVKVYAHMIDHGLVATFIGWRRVLLLPETHCEGFEFNL